jgi:hypothetical protein
MSNHDRVTKLLTGRAADPDFSFSQGAAGALLGRTTFGNALNAIKAANLAQQAAEQTMSLNERQVKLAEEQFDFEKGRVKAEGVARKEEFEKFWSDRVKEDGLSLGDQKQVYGHMASEDNPDFWAGYYEAVDAVGAKRAPAKKKKAEIINFRLPDGTFKAADANDNKAVDALIDQGGVRVGLSVQAADASGIGSVITPTDDDIEEARAGARKTLADIEELDLTISMFEENPQAGGIAGVVVEKLGGLLQQAGLGSVLERIGVDPAEVKRVRSQGRLTVSRLLTAITQEDTGRFTDTERRLAGEALSTLDPTASAEQITAAGHTALDTLKRGNLREVDRLRVAAGVDISTEEGQIALVTALMKNGYQQAQAIDAMLDLKERDAN